MLKALIEFLNSAPLLIRAGARLLNLLSIERRHKLLHSLDDEYAQVSKDILDDDSNVDLHQRLVVLRATRADIESAYFGPASENNSSPGTDTDTNNNRSPDSDKANALSQRGA